MRALLILFLFLSFHSFTQVDSAFSFDDGCHCLWWADNKMGGYDGFELRINGELKLLNYDVFTGEKWWIEGDHLFTEIRSRRRGNIFKTDYLITGRTTDSLVLNATSVDRSLGVSYTVYNYEKILSGNFTDQLLGHWDGEGESYLQIIPINGFRFQLVLSKNKQEFVEKFEGFLDEENKRIIFYLEREEKEMTIYFEAGVKTISISGKTYSRKC